MAPELNSSTLMKSRRSAQFAFVFCLLICVSVFLPVESAFAQAAYKIRTIIGGGSAQNGSGLSIGLTDDSGGITVGRDGKLYFSDANRVFRYDPSSDLVSLVAGTGTAGFGGDGGQATSALLGSPSGLAVDAGGNIYIADTGNSRIRRVDASSGIISTIAGTSTSGYSGDGGLASSANLNRPRTIVFDSTNGLLIGDSQNGRVRRVDLGSGQITTLVGGGSTFTDGIPASQYGFINISYLLSTLSGDLYIAGSSCFCVYKVDAASGIISTYVNTQHAHGETTQFDGKLAADLSIGTVAGLALDQGDNLLVTDGNSGRVMQVDKSTTIVTPIAGGGFNGDFLLNDTYAVDANLRTRALTNDTAGVLYIKDVSPARILRITPFQAGGIWQLYTRATGSGTVSLSPQGQSCGTNCFSYAYGTRVTATAVPVAGASFTGWSVANCPVSVLTCTVTVGSVTTVQASFTKLAMVAVTKTGAGSGTVISTPAGISCGATCSAIFQDGATVTLHAVPDTNNVFAGWTIIGETPTAACTDTGDCQLTASAFFGTHNVSARFEAPNLNLTVSLTGNGAGVVTSLPAGINCPPTCTAMLPANTQVLLRFTADSLPQSAGRSQRTIFSGWGGDCASAGTNFCSFLSGRVNNVIARFAKIVTPLRPTDYGDVVLPANTNPVLLMRAADGTLRPGQINLASGQLISQPQPGPSPSYRLLAATDLDGDGVSDLVFQNIAQTDGFGEVRIWPRFSSASEFSLRTVKRTWDVQAVGDLDGDGHADLVWRYVVPDSPDTGVSYVWFTDGNSVTQVRKRGGAPLDWKILGATDLNLDGAGDMIYASPDGKLRVLMATANRTCANFSAGTVPDGFVPIKIAHFAGRPQGEILIRNPTTGQLKLIALDAFDLDLPTYTGLPDDQNASCTASSTVIPSTIVDWGTADPSWTFYATSGSPSIAGFEDIYFQRPDGVLMVLAGHSLLGGPGPFTPAGTPVAGFTRVWP